ncbi:hypothetical protein TUBRATIS_26430 [Tubulinosema ratisbonensis]|uniref:Uncharacterized protein n=1 Tax=Tubulinosema ratisbonensis TaxID=291195 RepID=A0A437AIF2_9MICR|nr:hypothetical protein TUBRATIS_26430 [Tubulinosema ratisbonensis]
MFYILTLSVNLIICTSPETLNFADFLESSFLGGESELKELFEKNAERKDQVKLAESMFAQFLDSVKNPSNQSSQVQTLLFEMKFTLLAILKPVLDIPLPKNINDFLQPFINRKSERLKTFKKEFNELSKIEPAEYQKYKNNFYLILLLLEKSERSWWIWGLYFMILV